MDDTEIAEIDIQPEIQPVKCRSRLHGTYAAKKTVAQGMMDVALITANANQLKYVLQFGTPSPSYVLVITLITISLILQVVVGVSLIFKGRLDLSGEDRFERANKLNNYVVVGVFLISIINVFIASFSVSGSEETTQL